ncbi:MAG: dCMP deaminase family protein [Acidobacteriota bacterium]
MIVALLGPDSNLKTLLKDQLVSRSFYAASCDNLDRLETDKNHVIAAAGSPREVELLKAARGVLVWVGDSRAAEDGELVVRFEDGEESAGEKLSQRILREIRKQERPDWDEYFMKIAQVASMRSNCIKRKVGAVIVRDRRIISTGYNGTPRGTLNCNEGGCPRCNSLANSGTRLDECLCSHAEENAITQAAYHGVSVKGGTIYSTFAPCLMCSKMIINCGIVEVVFNVDYPLNETSFKLFEQAAVRIRQHRLT